MTTGEPARTPIASANTAPDEAGMAILEATDLRTAAGALLDALRAAGLEGTIAWTTADGLACVPEGGLGQRRDSVAAALRAHLDGAALADDLHLLCNGTADASAVLLATPAAVAALAPGHARLLRTAGRRMGELFAMRRLHASVQDLAQAEQLQRALFAIADMAGSEHDMPGLLKGMHGIIGQLMSAENFYIALFDRDAQTLQFAYFADSAEPDGPKPDQKIPIARLERGLTWYVIHDCKPLMGSHDAIRRQISGELHPRGADSLDWLGVPMLRDGVALGALVVQSYRQGDLYTAADQAVLSFVAEHVLNAVERKRGQEELEQRVAERTRQLAEANAVLQDQIAERERVAHLQATLYRIAALTNNHDSDAHFYRQIHLAVGELINAENFYIALVSDDGSTLHFPYSVDATGEERIARPMGRGLSEYVIRHGKTLLIDEPGVRELTARGEFAPQSQFSARSAVCWLGVPLLGASGVMGTVAVQSYRTDLTYGADDAELLTFVSHQIASSLQRRQQAEALRKLNAELEQRVQERTRELRQQITVREQVEAKLKHQVMHDPLTGLPNRLYLRDRLERALAGQRRNPERSFALLYLDVDRFKLFNDSLGHLAGDEVLREVSRRLQQCVRDPDVVARLSGDEFAILLEECPVPVTAYKVAQRIQSRLQSPMQIADRELQASASIGIAISQARHHNTDELLHDADVALYRAKAAGRQRFVLFDETLQQSAMNVLDVEQQLRNALINGEFQPFFQPIVRLDDGGIVGYEALLRWRHPERGLVGPGEFLPVAEESGLIEAIDWHMYRLACQAGAPLVRDGGFLTINISPRHFQNEDFDQRLLALAAETGFDPGRLRIEVTEGTLLGDPEAVARILKRLREACVEAALDDFGTGYSSLGYVHRFPLKMIKIDRSFVEPLDNDRNHRSTAIVGAVLSLARSLDVEVVAEGVETEAQRQALLGMGCVYAQGYFFGKPAAAAHWVPDAVLPA
ncbi:MAG: EAL domain-containing protein [Lysobacter sp.]|nr:EAL domain-containing protein [Lysobacter sp.]